MDSWMSMSGSTDSKKRGEVRRSLSLFFSCEVDAGSARKLMKEPKSTTRVLTPCPN